MRIQDIFIRKKEHLSDLERVRRGKQAEKQINCPSCRGCFSEAILRKKMKICPDCGYYFTMNPQERIRLLADEHTFCKVRPGYITKDPLCFPDYEDKLKKSRLVTGENSAVVTGTIQIGGIRTAIAVLDSRFFMGSLGSAEGEQITAIVEYAERKKLPLLIVSASGGARMQEGMFSLMQMAKTAAAIEKFKRHGGLYISLLTNPTTGGVSASFAALGDIMLAEPEALICFAGPRVIEQTIGQKLPEGFQKAEFLEEHGMLDRIVCRKEQKQLLTSILHLHVSGEKAKVME